MENQSPFEQKHQSPESPSATVERLPARLGFVETEELENIRKYAVEAYTNGDADTLAALHLEYQLQGEEQVNNLHGDEYMRGQIGLIVAKANLYRDTGKPVAFLESIRDAKNYAFNIYDDETVSILEKAPSKEIVQILSDLGEECGFDTDTLADIADLPYAEAFEVAYGYLIQTGIDADEVLAVFIKDAEQDTE